MFHSPKCGILCGGPQRYTLEQAKEYSAMAFVKAPEKRKVVVACMSHVFFAAFEDGVTFVRQQSIHRNYLLLGRTFGAISSDQITERLYQLVGALSIAHMAFSMKLVT